jgi:enamine deaminase RidA (YjgF/YER057c/UK114 family)
MTAIRKVSSGGPFEDIVGYSRAVAAGDYVFVSGCTSVVDGVVVHEGDMGAQAAEAIATIGAALARVGASLSDVIRTRIFVTDISRWEEVAKAHRDAFGDARPAATMVQVAALIDPEMLVEIEAVAFRPGAGGSGAGGSGADGPGAGGHSAGGSGLGWPS